MKTKEAIKWIFDIYHDWENIFGYNAEQNLKSGNKLDQVIDLLERGEKFEQMWEGIKKDSYGCEAWWSKHGLMRYEQKYFPKEANHESLEATNQIPL